MGARIVYVEIPAPDIERATTFYRTVFDWDIQRSDLSDYPYAMFGTGKGQVGGGLDASKQVNAEASGVILYLDTNDIPATLARIEAAGGSVVQGKKDIGGGYGYFAIFKDPCGNRLGLVSGS